MKKVNVPVGACELKVVVAVKVVISAVVTGFGATAMSKVVKGTPCARPGVAAHSTPRRHDRNPKLRRRGT
jgi:hypothetical protein